MAQDKAGYGGAALLNLDEYPTAQEFVKRCHEFFNEVKNLCARINPSRLASADQGILL